ncbi:P-loop NTPase fold protein [Paraburkholderia sp. BR10936]|uniref:KAP family P-loop NTPase fold protein n=1 Tax=Paraburkholderia sp. BR10936 TaxID=3236993 RepID=UPI0034D164A7
MADDDDDEKEETEEEEETAETEDVEDWEHNDKLSAQRSADEKERILAEQLTALKGRAATASPTANIPGEPGDSGSFPGDTSATSAGSFSGDAPGPYSSSTNPNAPPNPTGPAAPSTPAGNSPSTDNGEPFSIHIAGDNWTTDDTLGFAGYAYAIAAFLTHKKSKPPLTISIQAPWGGGKTSLMRMIQKQLDPQASMSAERDRAIEQGVAPRIVPSPAAVMKPQGGTGFGAPEAGLTLESLKGEIDKRLQNVEEPLPRIEVENAETSRVTVWFNAWKYESTNQVWAGLADAILQQVPNRLKTRAEKETFWLRLNLARVNSAAIRQKLHNYFIHRVLRTTIGLGWAIGAAALSFVAVEALSIMSGLAAKLGPHVSLSGLSATVSVVVLTTVKSVAVYFKVKNEPVSEVLNDIVDVPRYEGELGFVHQVEKDIRRVFDCLSPGTSLVIFIDDLDRCSPPKVSAVLDAINLFLAGDFPECSFVFGMDSEMVAAALQTAHKDLWAALPADAKVPIGWRFMDKFVQLPFVIPTISSETQEEFVDVLMGTSKSSTKDKPTTETTSTPGSASSPQDKKNRITPEQFRDTVNKAGAFDDNNPEVQRLIRSAMPLFKGNPRELKIFLNLFRFNHLIWYARHQHGNEVPSKDALCKWTALSVKWPEHVRWLRRTEPRPVATGSARGSSTPFTPSTTLQGLEYLAADCENVTDWKTRVVKDYVLRDDTSWAGEDTLFSLYKELPRLSEHAGKGFW